MPIRPIEIMKSQEASQLKHVESQRNQHEQVQINKNFQNLIQAENSKTTHTAKSDNKDFRYDAKEKGQNGYSGSPNRDHTGKEKEEEKKNETREPEKSGGIDILI